MKLLLNKGKTAKRPSPQLLMTFDEDSHPRAQAGAHDDKYRGGEFVPKDKSDSAHPQPPSFFPEREREADFSADADPDRVPKEEKFHPNYPFTEPEALLYAKCLAITCPDTKFVVDVDPNGDGNGVWDEESSHDYCHGIDPAYFQYNDEEALAHRKMLQKKFKQGPYDIMADLDQTSRRRVQKSLKKAVDADHPRAGKGQGGKYKGGQFVPKGSGSKAPAGQASFDFDQDDADLDQTLDGLQEHGEKAHLAAQEPDSGASRQEEGSPPQEEKPRLNRPLDHDEAATAEHLFANARNEVEESGEEREPGSWEAAHAGLQAAQQGPDALHDHLAQADDPHAEAVRDHLGVHPDQAQDPGITPEQAEQCVTAMQKMLAQEKAENDRYNNDIMIGCMEQGLKVAEGGPQALADYLAKADPDESPAYDLIRVLNPNHDKEKREALYADARKKKEAEAAGHAAAEAEEANLPEPGEHAPLQPITGEGRRGGRPISEIGFGGMKEKFGLREWVMGRGLSKEAQQFHMHGMASAALDLADVTGLPDTDIGFKGHLKVSVGAGTVRNAGAYYAASERTFNLGRTNGAGAVAHEWFHALDHALVADSIRGASPFASNYPDNIPNGKTRQAFQRLVQGLAGTQFQRDALKMGGQRGTKRDYWHKKLELLARGFEAYVTDKLAEQGRQNTYLADDSVDPVAASWRKLGHEPYPQGEERRLLNHRFDKLFEALREEPHLLKSLRLLLSITKG